MGGNFDPVDAVIELLKMNVHVVKEDGSLANIQVSREWLNQEAVPSDVDGQITVGLAECAITKVELSGRLRRQVYTLRVNVWSRNDSIRRKMVEEVNRVVGQNRHGLAENVAYLDVAGFRNLDRVDVKPFIYRTELVLKSWSFMDMGA
ncbi:MAG: hypothetical protein NZ932_05130 [Candidatus Bathyarchaeota archaeon]|nr:hypothetical protein [Candidatus Bathyarchaeota archaeon]